MSFFAGVGRFARARGNSAFARAFNGETPRRFASCIQVPVFSQSFSSLGERPLTGFAEQFKSAASLLNVGCLSASDEEAQVLPEAAEDATILSSWSILYSVSDVLCTQQHIKGFSIKSVRGGPLR